MVIEEVLGALTLILLFGAAVTALTHILSQLRRGRRIMSDFTILISIFIVGWLVTEMLTALGRGSFMQAADVIHLMMLVSFAAILTFRWRWAMKEAEESLGGTT